MLMNGSKMIRAATALARRVVNQKRQARGSTAAALAGKAALGLCLLTGIYGAPSPAGASGSPEAIRNRLIGLEASSWARAVPEEASTCVLQSIACGQTINGSLDPGDCMLSDGSSVDFFQFNGTPGESVSATLTSNAFPPFLVLLDPTPTARASDGEPVTAHISFTLDSSGLWTLAANNDNPFFQPGNYTLSLNCGSSTSTCTPDSTTLCIDQNPGDGRFKIQVSYHTSEGGGLSGSGNAIALSSLGVNEGGLFWFFGASNPEMLIKVLDGCGLGGHFWVFFAATTNVGFTVTVTDTQTGHQAIYTNPDNHAAPPVQDTSALTCP
jgi:hypothetical protein